MKTVDFSGTIEACDLKVGSRRQLIDLIRYVSIKGQGHFFTIYFQVLYVLCFTWPRYQVSVYRTIGPLVNGYVFKGYTKKEGRSGAVDRASDFGPRGPWFDSPPVHISLWP